MTQNIARALGFSGVEVKSFIPLNPFKTSLLSLRVCSGYRAKTFLGY